MEQGSVEARFGRLQERQDDGDRVLSDRISSLEKQLAVHVTECLATSRELRDAVRSLTRISGTGFVILTTTIIGVRFPQFEALLKAMGLW